MKDIKNERVPCLSKNAEIDDNLIAGHANKALLYLIYRMDY